MLPDEVRKAVERMDTLATASMRPASWQTIRARLVELEAENERLRDVLLSAGFVPCDSACMCGSWHHRYGLAARFRDIQDVLREAGVLDSATGSHPIDGVRKLIEQRDTLTAHLSENSRD